MHILMLIILIYSLFCAFSIGVALFMVSPILAAFILLLAVILGVIDGRNDSYKIRVKYFEPDFPQIQKISKGDWIDLRAAERVEMKAGEYRLIRLGVGMILPDGYEAHILPRSSTPDKFGIMIANSMGVIDNSYSGDGDEWKCPAYAIRDTVIEKGDRIAQFRIMENQPRLTFERVFRLRDKNRGGIGSTGKR